MSPQRPLSTAPRDARDPALVRARAVARVLDHRFLDPALGLLLPGVGDVVGSLFGLYLVRVAVRRDLPRVVIARMVLYLAIDTLLGVIPIVGDVFDFFFRANIRNLALLEARHRDRRAQASDWIVVAGAALAALAALVLPVVILVALIRWIF
ncbi:MAG TPA: DUF4112 domain-containing protein [Kofleriaceae bacterium]|nr:DUF4112 domain-containing protein [Kofleriaceae bacterium]